MDFDSIKTIKAFAAQHPKVREWLAMHKTEFYDALGTWPFDDDVMVVVLAEMKEYFGGEWPAWKNDVRRFRCDTLQGFLNGHQVDDKDLAGAIILMRQSFNAAIDKIHSLERRLQQQSHRHIPRKPYQPMRG